MTDRRRTPRYVLNTPLAGEAMPMQDAMVERHVGDRLVVIAPSAHRPDDELMVHLPARDGLTSYRGVVVSSTAVSMGGTVCFRLELKVGPAEAEAPESLPEPEGHA